MDTTCSPYRNVEEKVPGILTPELRDMIPDLLIIIGLGADIIYFTPPHTHLQNSDSEKMRTKPKQLK